MLIEVLIGNEDPVVYPLNSTRIMIGSSNDCEITIATEGISRKHISILREDDKYYLIDQGSTNGSFLNEERLVPGRKIEFTTFFPVRLSSNVVITLMSDEDRISYHDKLGPSKKLSQKEQTNSYNSGTIDLNKDLKKKIRAKAVQGTSPKNSQKKSSSLSVLAILIVVGAVFIQFHDKFDQRENSGPEEVPVQNSTDQTSTEKIEEKPSENYLLPESEIIQKSAYKSLLDELKCSTEMELMLCKFFPEAEGGNFGVFQSGLTMHVLVNGLRYFEKASSVFGEVPKNKVEDLLGELAVYFFLQEVSDRYLVKTNLDNTMVTTDSQTVAKNVSPPLDLAKYNDMKFSIALLMKNEDGSMEVRRVIAMKPHVIHLMKDALGSEVVKKAKKLDRNAFNKAKQFYRSY